MKKFFYAFLIFSFCIQMFGQAKFTNPVEEFTHKGVQLKIPKYLKQVPLVNQQDTNYSLAFQFPDSSDYELRIGLYDIKEIGNLYLLKNDEDICRQLIMMSFVTGMNISGDENLKPTVGFFKRNDVKLEFNADYGTTFSVNGKSDFAGKYGFVMINSFYKIGVSYFVIYHLFKDQKTSREYFTKNKLFPQVFDCAEFK